MDGRTQGFVTIFSRAIGKASDSIQICPVIVPASGLTVLFNLTLCFLNFLQTNAMIAHPSMSQFSRISYSLVIIILNSVVQ